jgi:hypothetical protein
MKITIVKKIEANGNLCRKSASVSEDLKKLGLIEQIDQFVMAEESNPSSQGVILALKHNVEAAPFFIVEEHGSTRIYTAYSLFLKEIFNQDVSEKDEIAEMMAQNPDLSFI